MTRMVKVRLAGVVTIPVFEIYNPDDYIQFLSKAKIIVIDKERPNFSSYLLLDDMILYHRLYYLKMKRLLIEQGYDEESAYELSKDKIEEYMNKIIEAGAIEGRLFDMYEFIVED